MSELANARRTLDKAQHTLQQCLVFFARQGEMNAAAHLSDRVMYPPIHGQVESTLKAITMFTECYPGDEA